MQDSRIPTNLFAEKTTFSLLAEVFKYPFVETMDGIRLDGAPCCCPACDSTYNAGHYMCHATPTPALLSAEEEGIIWRHLSDSGWRWYLA